MNSMQLRPLTSGTMDLTCICCSCLCFCSSCILAVDSSTRCITWGRDRGEVGVRGEFDIVFREGEEGESTLDEGERGGRDEGLLIGFESGGLGFTEEGGSLDLLADTCLEKTAIMSVCSVWLSIRPRRRQRMMQSSTSMRMDGSSPDLGVRPVLPSALIKSMF